MQAEAGGRPSKGLTAAEFTELMCTVYLPYIKRTVAGNRTIFPRGMQDVLLVMDNAKWHVKAVKDGLMAKLGLTADNLLTHPPNSPDFQGPIEWAHGRLQREVAHLLASRPKICKPATVKALIKRTWEGSTGKDSSRQKPLLSSDTISKSFRKLRHSMKQVVDAEGGWGRKGN